MRVLSLPPSLACFVFDTFHMHKFCFCLFSLARTRTRARADAHACTCHHTCTCPRSTRRAAGRALRCALCTPPAACGYLFWAALPLLLHRWADLGAPPALLLPAVAAVQCYACVARAAGCDQQMPPPYVWAGAGGSRVAWRRRFAVQVARPLGGRV